MAGICTVLEQFIGSPHAHQKGPPMAESVHAALLDTIEEWRAAWREVQRLCLRAALTAPARQPFTSGLPTGRADIEGAVRDSGTGKNPT